MTSAQKLMVYQTRLGCHHPISRIRKWDPRSGKGGILLPPNLLVLLLAQMRPGRFPLPRACSMTVSEEARNEEVKSSHFRRERSRTRAAGRPGSQAPLHPRSRPRFCSDPPHPNPLPSEDLTVPFLPPSPPRETPRPAAHRGGAPLSLPRLSKIGKHPAPLSHGEPPPPRPFTPQPLPPHLQPTSDLPPGPKEACPGAPPLPYVPAYVPARRRNGVTVRLVPPGGSV